MALRSASSPAVTKVSAVRNPSSSSHHGPFLHISVRPLDQWAGRSSGDEEAVAAGAREGVKFETDGVEGSIERGLPPVDS